MLRKIYILIISMFFLAFLLDGLVEAGRLGGGRSFGSRPSYQRSYQRPTAPQRDATPEQAQPQRGPAGRPGGLFGGFGGMLGGLLMGSLLGSLLFGGGMRDVAGPGLLDILVIAGGLYLLFRYLRSRRTAAQDAGATYYEAGAPQSYDQEKAGAAWVGVSQAEEAAVSRIPPDFRVEEFMKGAKAAYNRLQDSWNKRDLEDIRQFTSPEIWEEINRQALEDPAPGKTEILLVNAKLLEVSSEGEDTVASVSFDVLMRETPEQERPKQVREVWHFSRKTNVPGSFWRLEGIQQMEE